MHFQITSLVIFFPPVVDLLTRPRAKHIAYKFREGKQCNWHYTMGNITVIILLTSLYLPFKYNACLSVTEIAYPKRLQRVIVTKPHNDLNKYI